MTLVSGERGMARLRRRALQTEATNGTLKKPKTAEEGRTHRQVRPLQGCIMEKLRGILGITWKLIQVPLLDTGMRELA